MSADEFSPPPPGALAQFDEDFGDWKLKPVVTAGGTNYATLTINGETVTGTDVRVTFTEDESWQHSAIAWPRFRGAPAGPGSIRCRGPRWYVLRDRRLTKAAAKREKMRAARYAARWEQAHLRGEK